MISQYILTDLKQYQENGFDPGSFLRCVLENDLFGAMGRADERNQQQIYEICYWIENNIPKHMYGSPSAVEAWIKSKKAQS